MGQESGNLHEHPIALDIMTEELYILDSKCTLNDALHTMMEKRISSIIIRKMPEDQYFLVSQHDIISFLYQYPEEKQIITKEVLVRDLMQGPIDILDENMPLDQVIRYLFEHGYKRAFFGAKNVPRGVISSTDIVMWNNQYFQPALPLMFTILDNQSGIIIGQHIFEENIQPQFNHDLIDILGGVLNSISSLLEEVYRNSGHLREIEKDMFKVLFEPREVVTGVLFADAKSISLRHHLHSATNHFCENFSKEIQVLKTSTGCRALDISKIAQIFVEK